MIRSRLYPAFFLFAIVLLWWTSSANATCTGSSPTWATTPDQASVSTCVSNASNGDTINVSAGSATWSSPPTLPNTKGLKIIGAGVGNTTLTLNGAWNITCSAGKPHRISGFTINGTGGGGSLLYITGTCADFRIDHNRIENVPNGTEAIFFNMGQSLVGEIYGLVDNNVFTTTGTNFRAILIRGNINYGSRQDWPNIARLGTANNIFIEDNTFYYANGSDAGNGTTDSNQGAAFVFRFNKMTNSFGVTSHGVCNAEGTANQEAYHNTFVAEPNSVFNTGTRLIHNQGSGEAMYFGNRFTASAGHSTAALTVQHYRSGPAADSGCGLYPRCDGSSGNAAWDGNHEYGYPCRYQPGRKLGNVLSPMYVWNNSWTENGALVSLNIDENWSGPPYEATHVAANRDYYNAMSASAQTTPTSPFNGTTGMGYGTLANRPTTCTASSESGGGVGYWATDQGEWNSRNAGPDGQLYRCSATNTWTLHYTPYPYPHSLQGGSGMTIPPSPGPLNVH